MKIKFFSLLFLFNSYSVFAQSIFGLTSNSLNKAHPYLTVPFHSLLDQETRSRLSASNELKLLPDGKSYEKKLKMIKSAEFSILMVVMSFECGITGQEMSEALISAKKRGVDVRLILDGMYAKIIPIFNKCYKKLEKNGIKVLFSPYSYSLRSLGKMLHDKILVTDLKEAVIGGQNMMDINNLSSQKNYNFRDTDVFVKGPIILDLTKRVIKLWKRFRRSKNKNLLIEKYASQIKEKEIEYKELGLIGKKNYKRWLNFPKGLCRLVGQEPIDKNYYLTNLYTVLAKYAQYSMVFETPQLMKVKFPKAEEMEKQIKLAARMGVQVSFITNGDDFENSFLMLAENIRGNLFQRGGLRGLLNKLGPKLAKKTGEIFLKDALKWLDGSSVKLWKYNKFIHSKMSSFDGIINVVGSYNFDRNSVTHNFESAIVCIDDNLGRQVTDQLMKDFSNSTGH
jgi:phosphatidylserine/phosphatidylglycerophosphate/cardiolipin synthase-like enzyme